MRRLLSPVALSALVLLGACSADLDVTNPDGSRGSGPQVVAPSGAACTTARSPAEITADLNALMAVLTPNNSSAVSKWNTILGYLDSGDIAAAQSELQTLIGFIELKYGQASGTVQAAYAELKAQVIDDISCYVELNSYDLNPGDTEPSVFPNEVKTAAVWFPPGAVRTGTNVKIETPTRGDFFTDLDGYPSYIKITLVDGDGNEVTDALDPEADRPIVVVCFPTDDPNFTPQVAERALLGHQSSDPDKGFELLPRADIPAELAAAVGNCGSNGLPIKQTALGRALQKVAEFLLPEKLYASYFFAFGGVGGSPEEFSPFGAFDPGLNFGGAGGSPEEFAPQALPAASAGGPQASSSSNGGTTVTGTADEDDNLAADYALPRVRVATPGGAAIVGATVTFTLEGPFGPDGVLNTGDEPDASQATLCNGAMTATAETDADGYAEVPCINFGTDPGVKNLRATFVPTEVDPLACIIDPNTALCATTAEDADVNFEVVTIPGAPAKLSIVGDPGATSAQAGVAMMPQPVLQVQDAAGNPISVADDVDITSVGVTNPDGSSCSATLCAVSAFTATTDQATGQVTFSGLALGGKVGNSYKLTFNATGLTSASAVVTVSEAGTALIEAVTPAGGTYTGVFDALVPVSPNPTVRVRDAYENPISNRGVTWTKNLADAVISEGPTFTNSSGESSVTWTLGAGSNSLTAALTNNLSVATSFTATAAKTIIAACTAAGTQKKTGLATYSAADAGYLGKLTTIATAAGAVRSVELAMSVTGQKSGTGGYTTDIRAYRVKSDGTRGDLIARGKPYNASNPEDLTLRIPGDNGSPALIRFNLTPELVSGVAERVAIGDRILFEVQIQAASTRTFQVWYNTRNLTVACSDSKVYAAGVTDFINGTAVSGVTLNARNYLYPGQ